MVYSWITSLGHPLIACEKGSSLVAIPHRRAGFEVGRTVIHMHYDHRHGSYQVIQQSALMHQAACGLLSIIHNNIVFLVLKYGWFPRGTRLAFSSLLHQLLHHALLCTLRLSSVAIIFSFSYFLKLYLSPCCRKKHGDAVAAP